MHLLLILALMFAAPSTARAASTEEELKKVQDRIQEHRKKLEDAKEKESSVLDEIDKVNVRMNRIVTEVTKYRSSLRQTETEIKTVNSEIGSTRHKLDKQQDWLKRKLRIIYRLGYSGDVLIQLMSADDIAQLMRTWKYLQDMSRHEQALLKNYRSQIASLKEREARLVVLQKELDATSKKLQTKEAELAEEKTGKEKLLHSVRGEKALHQKMIAELRESQKRLQDLLRDSAKKDDYAGVGGFAQLKGKLLWPADGKVAVPYGTQRDAQFDTPVFRNGIHIQTSPDASARCVYPGKVILAEWFKGFGQLVIVNHGNGYHTLYGNLSEIFSKVGDIIKDNQTIGKVGVSGVLNTYGLYFEVRYKGKPLDPSQWLSRKK